MKIFNKIVAFFIIAGAISIFLSAVWPDYHNTHKFGGPDLAFLLLATLFLFIAVVLLSINAIVNLYKKY